MGKRQMSAYMEDGIKDALDHYCGVTKKMKSKFLEESLVGRALYLHEKAQEALKANPKNKAVQEYFGKELEGLRLFKLYQDEQDLIEEMVHDHSEDEIEKALVALRKKAGVK